MYTGEFETFALAGFIRARGESDACGWLSTQRVLTVWDGNGPCTVDAYQTSLVGVMNLKRNIL